MVQSSHILSMVHHFILINNTFSTTEFEKEIYKISNIMGKYTGYVVVTKEESVQSNVFSMEKV